MAKSSMGGVPAMSRPSFPTGSSNANKAAAHGQKQSEMPGGKAKPVKAMKKVSK